MSAKENPEAGPAGVWLYAGGAADMNLMTTAMTAETMKNALILNL
jgi:hypothetical protein